MKKINNKIKFIKKYWYFSLLVVPFVLVCLENKTPDNDIWFLFNNGKYVLNYGIPHTDPFTIHIGLHYVMQQWLSSVILYSSFHFLGERGLLILVLITFNILLIILYKLCYLVSKNRFKSVLITTIALSIIPKFIVTRPQIFTFTILLLETYLLEKYTLEGNKKSLYALPFLSLLLINLHSAMWFLQFIFILPFLVSYFIKKENVKDLLIVSLIMFVVGFINPYGLEAITFVFKSYGIKVINENILEMYPSSISFFSWKVAIILLLLFLFVNIYLSKNKLDYRYIFFVIGTFILGATHIKCVPYCIIWLAYGFSAISFRKFKTKINLNNNTFRSLKNGISIGVMVSLIITFFYATKLVIENYGIHNRNEDIINYVLEEYDVSKINIYTSFEDGGYTEYNNMKSYFDPRAELFFKKLNKKYDIFSEAMQITKNPTEEYSKKFLKKYNFTHLLLDFDCIFERYVREDSNYVKEYTEYFDEKEKLPYKILYVRKDISVVEKMNKENRK